MTDFDRLLAEEQRVLGVPPVQSPRPPCSTAGLVVRRAKDIEPRPIRWLWRRRLPLGRYIELVGYPGIGKTAVMMDIIARLTTDGRFPDGGQGEATNVVIAAAEDEADDVLVPRLIAAGADRSRVHFIDGIRRGDAAELAELDLSKALDLAAVVRLFQQTKATFGFIDALDDVLGAKHDGKGQTETRRALAPIRQLAKLTGATILGLRHPTKRVAVGPALNSGNGGIAYVAVARGSLLITIDPADPDRRLLLATKSNVSRLADTLAFRLESRGDDDDHPPKVVWDARSDPRSAADVLAELRKQENAGDAECDQSRLAEARTLVEEWLTPDGTPDWMAVTELERLARQRGVAPKTLRLAKEELGLQFHRDGFGPGSRMLCALPGIAPYLPISRDVGEYGGESAKPAAQSGSPQSVTESVHTRPLHTRPSGKTGGWASMRNDPDEAARTAMREDGA